MGRVISLPPPLSSFSTAVAAAAVAEMTQHNYAARRKLSISATSEKTEKKQNDSLSSEQASPGVREVYLQLKLQSSMQTGCVGHKSSWLGLRVIAAFRKPSPE